MHGEPGGAEVGADLGLMTMVNKCKERWAV